MSLVTRKYIALFCAVGACTYVAACGDSNSEPDARIPNEFDAAGPDAGPDAAPPDATILSGTLAVIDTATTNVAADLPPSSGAVISVSFTDPKQDTGSVVVNTGQPGCKVIVYDLDATPPQHPAPELDQGAVTITGTDSPAGLCAFNAKAMKYVCVAGAPTAMPGGTVVTPGADPTKPATIANFMVDWSAADPVGMQVQLSGFANDKNNGVFPVVGVADAPDPAPQGHHVLAIGNPGAAAETLATATSATFFTGAGPTPVKRPFLKHGVDIKIEKAMGSIVAAITFTLKASGLADPAATPAIAPFKLDDASVKPEAMPLTATGDLNFSCSGAGGSCGDSSTTTGVLPAIVVQGSTTDGDLTDVPTFKMPAPKHKFATFSCSGIGSSVQLKMAAWAAVLATNPTKIETHVVRGAGVLDQKGIKPNAIVGASLVGWTVKK